MLVAPVTSKLERILGVRWLSLIAALPLAGCGSTGLAWVGEAHLQSAEQTVATSESHAPTGPVEPIPAAPPLDPEEDAPRPRLSHTVTLGEGQVMGVTGRTATGSATSGGAGVSVTVNNYNVMNAPSLGYGYARSSSPGYFRGSLGSPSYSRPSVGSVSSSPQPGQNWPAVSDNGPSYPFRSAPASPWSRTP